MNYPRANAYVLLLLTFQSAHAVSAENLALGAKVEFIVGPNYFYSRDANDAKHLTDGDPNPDEKRWLAWTKPQAVGWVATRPALILDLGEPKDIGRVVLRSKHSERVGVYPPQSLAVYAADAEETFVLLGRCDDPQKLQCPPIPEGEDVGPARAVLNTLKYRARRLMVAMKTAKNLSIDEIEVYADHEEGGTTPGLDSPLPLPIDEVYAPLLGEPVDVEEVMRKAKVHAAKVWARPLGGGPVETLFVLPAASVRDAVELTARAELTASVIPFYYQRALDPVARVRLKKALLDPPSTCVLGGLVWEQLSTDARGALFEAARSRGVGIVWVHTSGSKPFETPADAVEEQEAGTALSASAIGVPPETTVRAYRLGKGRIAVVQYRAGNRTPPMTLLPALKATPDLVDVPRWEGCCVTLLRSALWVAGRLPSLMVVERHGAEVAAHAPRLGAGRVTVEWYDRFWQAVAARRMGLTEGGCRVPVPPLPRGPNLCTVTLHDEQDAALDFAVLGIEGRDSVQITELATQPKPVDPAREAHVLLTVESKQPVPRTTVHLRVLDPWDRLLVDVRREVSLTAGRNDVRVPIGKVGRSPRAVSLRIDASVLAEDDCLAQTRRHVPIRQQRKPAFFFEEWSGLSWWAAGTSCGLALTAEEQRLGVDATTYYGVNDFTIRPRLARNVRVNPLGFGRVTVKPKELRNLARNPCLADPKYFEKLSTKMLGMVQVASLCQPDSCFSGDEQSLGYWSWPHDLDRSSLSLRRFRAWLHDRYENVAALNTAWATSFENWDDVMPITMAEARERPNPAAWIEFRRFMDSEFVGLFERLGTRLRQDWPDLRVGLSGMAGPSSFNGHDYRALVDGVSVAAIAYDGLQRELLRCWAGEDDRVSAWSGYDFSDSNERYDRFHPWYMLLHGCHGGSFFSSWGVGYGPYRDSGMISVNGFASRHGEWIAEEMTAIGSGVATLLRGAKRLPADIAILFSMESLHGATCRKWGRYATAVYGMTQAIEDLGFQYDVLAPQDVTQDRLARYRLIVLPSTFCLSENGSLALLGAAERGAVLLADWGLGTFDEHGTPRTPTVAASLCGVGIKDEPQPWSSSTKPVRRRVGKGSIFLLPTMFPEYAWFQLKGQAQETEEQLAATEAAARAEWRSQLREVVRQAGCSYGPEALHGEEPATDIEKVVYRDGSCTYVALLRKYRRRGAVADGQPATFTVSAPKLAVHAYDLRLGRYQGATGMAHIELRPSEVGILAFLPYRVDGLHLERPRAPKTDVAARVMAQSGTLGRHVLYATVQDPQGRSLPALERVVETLAGPAVIDVPMALNDASGQYTVIVRDVASGTKAEATYSR